MIENLFTIVFYASLSVMALLAFGYLFRSIIGPLFFDRILAVNSIGTLVILIICILAVVQNESYIVDVALIYAMLSFVTVVIVSKAYLGSHKKDKSHDFARFKKEKEKDD